MKKFVLKFTVILVFFFVCTDAKAKVIYVNESPSSNGNTGLNWANAFPDLQDALDNAVSGDTIWVAKGTYYPTSTPDTLSSGPSASLRPRDRAFLLTVNARIYGGFDGTETLQTERDSTGNETILSGDFNNDDIVTGSGATLSITNNTENAHHVFMLTTATSAILDGFTIKGGNANGSTTTFIDGNQFFRAEGGGIYMRLGNIQLSNLRIINNSADYGGGLNLQSNSGNTVFNNVKVQENENDGVRTEAVLTISNSTFSGNKGRGIYFSNVINAIIRNSLFSNNSYEGVYCNVSSATFTNNTFYGNSYGNPLFGGGGIHTRNKVANVIKNCVFWNNFKDGSNSITGSDIFHEYNFADQIPTVEYCLTQQGSSFSSGTGIINNQNPLFVDAGQENFYLLAGSPALDEGDNSAITGVITDIAGNTRIQNTTVDMGAYEGAYVYLPRVYVDSTAMGSNTGANWTDAYTDLQDAIDNPYFTSEIWVAKGTYLPSKDPTGNASPTEPRNKTFHMATNRNLYGGFTGTETALSQRDWAANPTILSADFSANDVVKEIGDTISITGNSENAFHVLITANLTSFASIDGFTVKGGNANGGSSIAYQSSTFYQNSGGGIVNDSSSLALKNMTFSGNFAEAFGGSIYNYFSSPIISNSTFSRNKSVFAGGGISNWGNSSPFISNSMFLKNSSSYWGGAIHNDGSKQYTLNSTFSGNHSNQFGGAMFNGGNDSTTVTNSTFYGNSSDSLGGAIYTDLSAINIVNSIFWQNVQKNLNNVAGADIDTARSIINISYSLTQENSKYSSGTGIINNQDPLFTDGPNSDFNLTCNSPPIDQGTPTGASITDISGYTRIGNPDMGAYEFVETAPFVVPSSIADAVNPSYMGSSYISSEWPILNTNIAVFKARRSVELKPGFNIAPTGEAASVFTAEIGDGCP